MKRLFFILNLIGMIFCFIGNAYAYKLPYPAGKTYKVIQGNSGSFTHNKEKYPKSIYAFDFSLKNGDTVVAAASGEVHRIKMYSTKGGCNKAYANDANYIVIDHGNGQASLYMHLKAYSSSLKVGDKVKAGQPIAQIGKSGYGCNGYGGFLYHLHFQVQELCSSWWCQSVRIRFDDVSGGIPQQDESYTSQNYQNTLSYIRISGNDTITENLCQYYTVYAYYTNGNSTNVTDKVYWGNYSWLTVSNFSNNYGNPYAKVCASSVSRDSYTELTANYNENGVYKMTKLPITIKNSDSSSSNTTSIPTAVRYINQCIDKYSNYFGTKVGSAEVCFEDYYCQDTTGGTLGDVIKIAVHKSQRDVFWYLWDGRDYFNSSDLSYCE